MKNNEQYWVIAVLLLILSLWVTNYQNTYDRYNNPYGSIKNEQDYINIARSCKKECEKILMKNFEKDEPQYNDAMIANCSQRCEAEYGSMSNGKWIWSEKYYDGFDTSRLSHGNILEEQ